MKRAATVLAFLVTFAACNQKQVASTEPAKTPAAPPAAQASASLTPEELGQLGARIHHEPARANEILSSRGLTAESFEKAIRAVTQDPEASRRYAAAYRKGGA